jgi:hypothetical protein
MGRPRATSALVPAAARGSTVLTETEQELSSQAIDTFTKALGGREALIDALAVANESPDVEKIVNLLLDPRFESFSLRRLCAQAGLTVADLFAAYKKAAIARAHLQAVPLIAQKLIGVVDDVMTRAQPYEIPCTQCGGVGKVTPEPTKDQPNPEPQPCEPCRGGGVLLALPDLDRQKLALELGQLVTKGGGFALQVNQQNLNLPAAGSSAPGALEQLQQAVGDLLFSSATGGVAGEPDATIEAEVLPPTEEPAAPPLDAEAP